MTTPRLTFWFDIASPYTALTACRIKSAADRHGVAVDYRPFLLGVVLRERGWQGPPGQSSPEKWRYMWRDLERRSAEQGWTLRQPGDFPRNPVLADRVALVALRDGWLANYLPRIFQAYFGEDMDIADPDAMATLLRELGHDPAAVLTDAGSVPIKQQLKDNTADALARGFFGAPNFTIGDELFWGDDRLEDALRWAKEKR